MSALWQAKQALAEGRVVEAAKLVAEVFHTIPDTPAVRRRIDAADSGSEVLAFASVSSLDAILAIYEATPNPTPEVVEIVTKQVGKALRNVHNHTVETELPDPVELIADMHESLDALAKTFSTIPEDFPLRLQVMDTIENAWHAVLEAEDQSRHLSYGLDNPALLATFQTGALLL
jgi:hypothetical protein